MPPNTSVPARARTSLRDREARATTPGWLWLPAGLALLLCAGPVAALLLNVPWTSLSDLLDSDQARTALGLSLATSVISTLICVLLGLPLAVLFSKLEGPAIQLMRGILLIPLVLSPVVSGIALLYFWGRHGIAGRLLGAAGLDVGYSPAAVVIVQVFVSLPFFVVASLNSLSAVDRDLEMAAATSGAGPTAILRHITLPLALPGIVAGALLAFARSLGEYGATITFAGSIEGRTRTLPLQIELSLNSNQPQAALGICLMLIALYLLVLLLARLGAGRLLPR
ncbi:MULTISPECIES: ABC transporter permease [unclassified Arthrobacter]|uniref:ABC transporter permease n=1 Tax=unclassified Arthrobacter TaxID=235627 RepID=UPI001D158AD7|nr:MULTISPECIES: ABC transporter permease [unclassified Arthrobacter]MCC3277095.1 ABC transporter permease [Arthrobacter sp. zg-Y20]MCC3280579.1 ABC transporter permease [Arthrobacter sp. zg-Y40]MCC9178834.1 ABC transporter permease [Arthrobacter sp. zg-Y750]MDK1317256.1 ABC transporter permease [Arthrobacter sp. zg.Y20]MDK1328879.1 ABC transporter permease [Arthrobacter sp. zg-Y1143]